MLPLPITTRGQANKHRQSFLGNYSAISSRGIVSVLTYGSHAQFVKCDVRVWEDQVAVFEAAVQNSPSKSCDIVVANAGVVGADDLFTLQGL